MCAKIPTKVPGKNAFESCKGFLEKLFQLTSLFCLPCMQSMEVTHPGDRLAIAQNPVEVASKNDNGRAATHHQHMAEKIAANWVKALHRENVIPRVVQVLSHI